MKINPGHLQLSLFFILLLSFADLFAQEDVQIGSGKFYQRMQGGFYDYSDPSGINIKVQLWGYVKFPGYYVVPARSNINELISLGGGPTEDALLEDVRILRTGLDSSTTVYRYNYEELLWGDDLEQIVKFPRLTAGDMIIVPGEPRYFLRENVSFILGIITALASMSLLAYNILK